MKCQNCKDTIEKGKQAYFKGKVYCQDCWKQEKGQTYGEYKKTWLDTLYINVYKKRK